MTDKNECYFCGLNEARWCKICQENYCDKCHKQLEESWKQEEYLSPHQWYEKEIRV